MLLHKVFLCLGGNIGNKAKNFEKALEMVENQIGSIVKASSVYESKAWGFHSPDLFRNQVVIVETALSPEDVLSAIHRIEDCFGRVRGNLGYQSREMDIDILFYEDQVIHKALLVIPHQLLTERRFVLAPLAEIVPTLVHPVSGKCVADLLRECPDQSEVIRLLNIN